MLMKNLPKKGDVIVFCKRTMKILMESILQKMIQRFSILKL